MSVDRVPASYLDDTNRPLLNVARIRPGMLPPGTMSVTDRLPLAMQMPVYLACIALFGVGFIVVMVFAVRGWTGRERLILLPKGVLVGSLATLGPMVLSVRGMLEARTGEKRIRVCRRAKRCGGCLYDLRSVPADEFHLTRCPECGAAWDLRRDD